MDSCTKKCTVYYNLTFKSIELKIRHLLLLASVLVSFTATAQEERTRFFYKNVEYPQRLPKKRNVWIFIMAGQSNMAGRGIVEPPDTISNPRILTINSKNEIILAKEPLHFYEPNLTGLDCGLSFAKQLLLDVDRSVKILLIPTAVGGSSTQQWLGDSLHRNVKLLTNFRERVEFAKKYGTIKGILWHQGESDTDRNSIPGYEERLAKLLMQLRIFAGDTKLPIILGELGSFSDNQSNWDQINKAMHDYELKDDRAFVVDTEDLKSKEDKIHFNSEGQRMMGERMAKKFLEKMPR
jgi:hypothetical protein